MTANDGAMVREAIRAYRAGSRSEARALLEKAVEANQYNEQAWLWLSAVVETPDEQRTCLENVLVINPNNENARQGIAMLDSKSGAPAATSPSAPVAEDDPFADLDFASDSSPSASSGAAFTSPPPAVEPPTATSSASANYNPANEPSAEDYDAWMDSLDIGSEASPPASTAASPFGGSLEDDFSFLDDAATSPPPAAQSYNNQDYEDTFDDLFGEESLAPSSTSIDGPFSSTVLDDDMDFLDDVEDEPVRAKASIMSPGREAASSDDLLNSFETDLAGGDFITDYESGDFDEPDPAEYFRAIPKNIKSTRLPGTVERPAPILLVAMVALIIANLGALGLILSKIAG